MTLNSIWSALRAMGHLPHCMVCLVYTPVCFCSVVSTQCVRLFLHANLGFQRERLTAFGQASTLRRLSQTGEFPSTSLQLSPASSSRPHSGSLRATLCVSPAAGSTPLPASGLLRQPSPGLPHCTFLYLPHSGAHSYSCPFHPWSCHFSKSAGTPHHLLCEVFTSRSGDSSVWPSSNLQILPTSLLPGMPLPCNRVAFFLSNPFHL